MDRAEMTDAPTTPQAQPNWDYEGAMSDLDSAISVLIKRINGEADLASAAEWVRLNYPKRAGEIKAQPDARAVEARERVAKYLDRLRKARQNDPEHIHAFDTGEPSEAMLLASDLRALLSAPAADDGWNFDLSEAPEGEQVILATEGGHVGEAIAPVQDDPDDGWFWAGAGFVHKSTPPIAWRPLPAPPPALHPAAPTEYCPFCEYEEGNPRTHVCGAAPTDEVGKS